MSQLPGAASGEADSAIMQTLNPLADQGVAVGILKISATNVVILSPVRVLPGTLVQVRIPDIFVMGEARRCLERKECFEVLLDIEDMYCSPR
jgi:hypothetical protein